jgi:vitamin B12 transporter
LLNGIAINDQSATQGLFDFGQDFIQTIQQVEIYKGPSGAHFGPSAIGGAVNFITAIDYKNSVAISGSNGKNNSIDGNYTKITDNGWHLNFKSSGNQSKTNSAIADGTEKDAAHNISTNLNTEKWINDNTKFKTTLYSRKTVSDYDESANDEIGYLIDNRLYVFQTGIERVSKNFKDSLTFHYNKYDREYENGGYLDEFDSETLVAKAERKIKSSDKLSFGFGSEYKYDWGAFEDRGSYTASTKGYIEDMVFFGNLGYNFSENTILSLYGRIDNHKTTGTNETYKINLTKVINKFQFGGTHSTGLRNPTLYELYGTNNYGHKGNPNLNPEKSKTDELFGAYNFSNNSTLKITAYQNYIIDFLDSKADYSGYENKTVDLEQEGLETAFFFKGKDQTLTLSNVFSSSKKINGQSQNRRPDRTYGVNYTKKFTNDLVGPFSLNYNYEHFGKHIDYDGGNTKVDSTDIMNLSLSKEMYGNNFSLSISNLLDEQYERPATYSQDGRKLRFGFRKVY